MSSSEKIKANMNTGSKIFGKHIRPVLVVQNGNVDMQNNGKERQKSVLHVQTCFLLIRKKVCCTCNLFFSLLIRSIDLDAIVWWCYTERFATTIFSATQCCNVGTICNHSKQCRKNSACLNSNKTKIYFKPYSNFLIVTGPGKLLPFESKSKIQ